MEKSPHAGHWRTWRWGSGPVPAYRDRVRARLIALRFSEQTLIEQLAADLMTRCGRRPREAWRLANELSLDETAARYNTVSADPKAGMRKNRLWEFEQWPRAGSRPTLRTLRRLAEVFGTSWFRLVDLEDLASMPEEDRDTYHASVAAYRPNAPAVSARAELRLATTRAVVAADSDVQEQAIEDAAEESAALATWVGASNVDDDMLAQMDRETRAIAHAYVFSQPYPLFMRTRKLRGRVVSLLRGHQRWSHTRELHLIGARASTLLAWMSGDLGNYAAAGDHAWAGLMCAQHADHNGARAWVRATQSKLAFWDGDYVESARLAQDGLSYQDTDGVALLLALLESRAWARLGRVDDSNAALRRWEQLRQGDHVDEVGGVLGVSQAQEHYLAGSTQLWLREPAKALEQSRRSIELFEATPVEQRFYGAEMLARVDAARCQLREPRDDAGAAKDDIEAVEATLEPVLSLDPDQRLETFVQSLGHVRTALALPRYRENATTQDLQVRIEDFAQTAVGRTVDVRR